MLLGLRNNKPAQHFWFVPGGRVLKKETLDNAFLRLCRDELGVEFNRQQAKFLGPFEHFYEDCVFDDNISTHYVVLGYKLKVNIDITNLGKEQHGQYRWFTRDEIINNDLVHEHTKWYIK